MRKSYPPTGFESAVFGFRLTALWITDNPKTADSNPVEDNFFALLVLSSHRSSGSSLGFRAGIAFRP